MRVIGGALGESKHIRIVSFTWEFKNLLSKWAMLFPKVR